MITDSHVLVSGAVSGEVSGVINELESVKKQTIGGRFLVSGKINDTDVHVMVTGPGIVNTVQALTAAIEHKRPCLVIQTGCAGAFRQSGLQIGDIGIADQETCVHLGIEPENEEQALEELPFSLMTLDNLNIKHSYPIKPEPVRKAFDILSETFNICRIKTGPFITVSTITATDKTAERLYRQFAPCMEAMEGSGAAHICLYYNLPFLEIRAASNYVGKRDKKTWNLPLAFKRCNGAVWEILKNFDKFGGFAG
ncbi:Futalosine hydrolase [Desulfonema limicola]|uniref:Futalosine hydrolase n=1 Tax=Desulfonema limicola TaxID=45656 RepID=A0A975BDP7_9BACT|nr:futalosine hydrolase [Desulfonema limicola]QTA83451.1 Futalosine hydrolase [Desulfonema limicola]